ncbi:MAG: serine protease [Pseudomonadota bacterium]
MGGKRAKNGWLERLNKASESSSVIAIEPENGAPVAPGEARVENERYISVRLLHFHHPYARRAATKLAPAVYAKVAWQMPLDGEAPQERLISLGLGDEDQAKSMAYQGETLFGPVLYNGPIKIDLAMFVHQNTDAARGILKTAANAARILSLGASLIVDSTAEIAESAIDQLLPNGKSPVLLGLKRQMPALGAQDGAVRTGCWAILPGGYKAAKAAELRFDATKNALLKGDGQPLQDPYIVYAVETQERNPYASRIPEIAAAWNRIQTAISTTPPSEISTDFLSTLFQQYSLTVTLSNQLNSKDKSTLIEGAKSKFELQMQAIRNFASLESAETPEIETSALEDAVREAPIPVFDDGLEAAGGQTPVEAAERAADIFSDAIQRAEALDKQDAVDNAAAVSESLTNALEELIDAAGRDPDGVRDRIINAAEALRRTRRWRQLGLLGKELRSDGVEIPRMLYLNSLALVELGELQDAEALVSRAQMLAIREDDRFNIAESLALRGRIWKQRYVAAKNEGDMETARDAMVRAIEYYEDGDDHNDDPKDFFQRINVLALVCAARRHGWNLRKDLKPKAIAKKIKSTLTRASRNQPLATWDIANLAEAALALDLPDEAATRLREYIKHPEISPFHINATRRQLVEIWDIDPCASGALGEVITEMAVASMTDETSLTLTVQEINKLAALPVQNEVETKNLEALFDGDAALPVRHVLEAVSLGQFVGAVKRADGRPVGTGFMLAGEDLNDAWRGEMLFVTNDHVINPDPRMRIAVHPDEARVAFTQVDRDSRVKIAEELWRSPHTQHDVAVFRLDGAPDVQRKPIEIARGLPPRWRGEIEAEKREHKLTPPRVIILGHPVGRDLEVTFENNFLIDHEHPIATQPPPPEPVRIHYRAPTEPGSSGSPIFNARTLELIGVHHLGNATPLPGNEVPRGVDYEANQGHWIQAIRATIAAEIESGGDAAAPDRPSVRDQIAGAVGAATGALSQVRSPFESAESAGAEATDAPEPAPAPEPTPDPEPAPEPAAAAPESAPEPEAPAAPLANGAAEPFADADPDSLFWDNIDTRPDTADPSLEATRHQFERWETLAAPRPAGNWAPLDQSPDTLHLANIPVAGAPGAPFEVTDAVILKALAFASIPVDFRFGDRVLIGVRGAHPVGHEAWADEPQFRPAMQLTETTPDHHHPLCAMAVWNRPEKGFWSTIASTAPGVEYMWGQVKAGRGASNNIANMLPPGLYRYDVGTHANGTATRQPGAFKLKSAVCTLRNYDETLGFSLASFWDTETDANGPIISDNIHGAMTYANPALPRFASAGCQVVPGTMRDGRTRPDAQWRTFRMAAGLKELPNISPTPDGRPNSVQTDEDGAIYAYVLFAARELRIAAENLDAPDDDARFAKLRRGSKGDRVVELQQRLGVATDGDFGFKTQKALIELQLEKLGRADGVMTAAEAVRLGWAEPPEDPDTGGGRPAWTAGAV